MNIPSYDSWKLASGLESERVCCTCDSCGQEIYSGEDYYIFDGQDNLHEECLTDYIMSSPMIEKITG